MSIVTEACVSGGPGQRCPGTFTYEAADRHHGSIEFCGTCDTGHEWDAGIGRWQIRRLAGRLGRRFVDLADTIPAGDEVRSAASSAAPAAAVALLAGG